MNFTILCRSFFPHLALSYETIRIKIGLRNDEEEAF